MKKRYAIKDFYKRTIGYIVEDPITGDKEARDFYSRVLGYWSKKDNITRDFYKVKIGEGDLLTALIYENEKKRGKK